MPATFDGPTRLITLPAGETTVAVATIYSEWKAWTLLGDNLKYAEAFRVTGGDPLGGGVSAGVNVFIRNDYGWRIKPPEQAIDVVLTGNLYPEDPDSPWRAPTVGSFHTSINTSNAAAALIVAGSGGGGGGSAPSAATVAAAVWATPMTSTTPGTFGDRLRRLVPWPR
jgi:hypothetical protein